jgi:NitT/TauT family transport system substrate-binding protein
MSWTAAAVLVFVLASACGGEGTSAADGGAAGAEGGGCGVEQIDVGVIPIVAIAPLALGVEKGFFEEEGLDVELHIAQGGAALVPAVASGQYEFAFSNNLSVLLARARGLPVRIVSAANSAGTAPDPIEEALAVPAGSPIRSVADLAGQTVAVNTLNNIVHLANLQTLEDAGVDPSTVQFIEVGFPDMPLALEEGRVDAADVAEPFLTEVTQAGGTVIAEPFRVLQPDLYISSWFTTDQFIAQNSECVTAFVTALDRSKDYAAANTEEVRALIPELLGVDEQLAQEIALAYWPTGLPDEESLEVLGDAAVDYGVLAPEIRPSLDELLHQP